MEERHSNFLVGGTPLTTLPGSYNVISIPHEFVPISSWWLMRILTASTSAPRFNSCIMDEDGLSVICDASATGSLQQLIKGDEFYIDPQRWVAVMIDLKDGALESSGAVYHITDILSSKGLSLLHLSTYDTEVFLFHEEDYTKARSVLSENPYVYENAYPSSRQQSVDTSRLGIDSKPLDIISRIPDFGNLQSGTPTPGGGHSDIHHTLDMSWISAPEEPLVTNQVALHDFRLRVLPRHLFLARLTNSDDLPLYSSILINLMLYDRRFSELERYARAQEQDKYKDKEEDGPADITHVKVGMSEAEAEDFPSSFMWGVWQLNEEITLLLEEEDINKFPEGALVLSPQQWGVIKLVGRPIAFNEVGVVRAMTQMNLTDPLVPTLNISTAITNCTLVPTELIDSTLVSLAETIDCPIETDTCDTCLS